MIRRVSVIVPCAGSSKRYPGMRPKSFLINPNGNLMLVDAISKLDLTGCQLVVTVLKEHQQKYQLSYLFEKLLPKLKVRVCVLPKPTTSQSETIAQTIEQLDLTGPILIKDSDNIFKLGKLVAEDNYVALLRLADVGVTNAANKSYTEISNNRIVRIAEKQVISDSFCVGGYYFKEAVEFLATYKELAQQKTSGEIYPSHVIAAMLLKGAIFRPRFVKEYLDLGTSVEWEAYKQNQRVYLVDIDGVLVKNSAEYFPPYWGQTEGLKENIGVLNQLYDQGNQIILTTTRKEAYRTITRRQLKQNGVKYHQLVMGLLHGTRVLINDFSNTNRYPSSVAISLPRDSENLRDYLE